MHKPIATAATIVRRALALLALATAAMTGAAAPPTGAGAPTQDGPGQDPPATAIATAEVRLRIVTEDDSEVPDGSHFTWDGLGGTCRDESGHQPLWSSETPVVLPVCRLRLTLFVTGFNTQAVTLDLAGHADALNHPIRIRLRQNAPAVVSWSD